MNKQDCNPPETMADINGCIYTFLHLEESKVFQLLHNETNLNGVNLFQIYGKFRGNGSNQKFNLKEVDLKLVNFTKNRLYKIIDGKLEYNSENGKIDFFIIIEAVASQKEGIDKTIYPKFIIKNGEMIDFHVNDKINTVDSNGIPCNTKAYIS